MPWNDNKGGGGGPWGGGGSGGSGGSGGGDGNSPWGKPSNGGSGGGKPPGGGSKDRPDLEETLRRMQERFKRKGGSGGSGGGAGGSGGRGPGNFGVTGLVVILVIALVGWAFTGIYQVDERQQAVVLRFGTFHRYEGPGFRIRLPSPIEQHYNVETNTEKRTQIGGAGANNLMLTGDENIVDIGFVINWRIREPRDYLFNVVDQQDGRNELIEQIGESSMREVVGTSEFERITTGDRSGVEARVKALMQQTLNSYKAGVEVISISLSGVSAPEEVVTVQRDVSSAEQNKAKREADAIAYRNQVVPEAEGKARARLQQAEGYKAATVAQAKGEADRFDLVYGQYKLAPRVTRERMFLETMEKVIGDANVTIIDTKSGAVPIIPLDQLRGRQTPPQGQ